MKRQSEMEGDANGAPRDCTALQILLHLIIVVISATATKKNSEEKRRAKEDKKHTHIAVRRSNLLIAGAYSNFPLRCCSSFGIVFLLFVPIIYIFF